MARPPIEGTDEGQFIKTTRFSDTVHALGGNDRIEANAGANLYDGGDGFDRLDYSLKTGNGTTATQGIIVNIALDSVRNGWGRVDHLISVEWIIGSQFGDIYNFANSPTFQVGEGRNGADAFNATVLANVWLIHEGEAGDGATHGITVNLGAVSNGAGAVRGRITDGWGNVDTTRNIHHVEGTQFADSFIGSRLNDNFNGLDGADNYNGRGGVDFVYFDTFGELTQRAAVQVDLGRNGNEIINDGLSNTETATLIEGVRGSEMNDTIKGDGGVNYIAGDGGSDVLAGRGGADFFVYGFPNKAEGFGDHILDFVSGVDKIVLSQIVPGIEVGVQVQFSNGAEAGSATELCFFYDAAKHELFMDRDGSTGSDQAVMIAHLDRVVAMTAADMLLVNFDAFWG